MPGIAGIIGSAPNDVIAAQVNAMTTSMQHEPWHRSAVLIEYKLNLGVGSVAHEGSFADCMPIWNSQRDICLIFAGEHFAHGPEPGQDGIQSDLRSRDTAATLVRRYEERDEAFLTELNGWFSGVIVDHRQHKVILFNDRYGVNRLYYYQSPEAFYFASEAKAILHVCPEVRGLSMRSVGEFLACGAVLQNRTYFKSVGLVPGGSVWTFKGGRTKCKAAYFDPANLENQEPLPSSEYDQALASTWKTILPPYFSGPEEVALSLTGGVDSRLILACAPREQGKLKCYTFGGIYRD